MTRSFQERQAATRMTRGSGEWQASPRNGSGCQELQVVLGLTRCPRNGSGSQDDKTSQEWQAATRMTRGPRNGSGCQESKRGPKNDKRSQDWQRLPG